MPDTTLLLSQFYVKIDGTDASEHLMTNLVEATVENSLHLPDVATLVVHDSDGKWVDDPSFSPGKALVIDAKVGDKNKIIFWYRVEATDSYRAIFGDLRIEDIKPEQIPYGDRA